MKRLRSLTAVLVLVVSAGVIAKLRADRDRSVPVIGTTRAPWQASTSSTPSQVLNPAAAPEHSIVRDNGEPLDDAYEVAVVVPSDRASVRAAAAGTIGEILNEVGESVDAAQVLARIRDDELVTRRSRWLAQMEVARSRIREVEAELELARYDLKVKQQLENLVSELELTASRTRINMAEARLSAAKSELAVAELEARHIEQNLEQYRLRAPFSGRVTRILGHRYQFVDQGDIVLWIESEEKQLKLQLSKERFIERSDVTVSVRLPGGTWRTLNGGVGRPSYNADGTVTVVFELGRTDEFAVGQVLTARLTPAVSDR